MGIRRINLSKKGQAQVIVTVLLILIVLAAIGLVSTFIFSLIRDNLTGTECFKTIGQLDLNTAYTYYNPSSGTLSFSLIRNTADFDLTGIVVSVGGGATSKPYEISNDSIKGLAVDGGVTMYGGSLDIILPGTQETLTYIINVSSLGGDVQQISVAPLIGDTKTQCDVVIESAISSK